MPYKPHNQPEIACRKKPLSFGIWLLVITALVLLFGMLGSKEIWTQEWRWANICHQMIIRHNYLHPYLWNTEYYDKPLLSYWLIILFAKITHSLSTWAIRLPSAIAGAIALYSTYSIGRSLSLTKTGKMACWLLLSTFYFIFWARVGITDMLNVGGIMLAVAWYFQKRHRPSFLNYLIFFLILALASLCKGLVAIAIVGLVLLPELWCPKRWRQHMRPSLFIALCVGIVVYVTPFFLSSHLNTSHYGERGLHFVFRENLLRYLHPFDHQNPFYIYFIYLPLYIFPWIFFFIPAIYSLPKRWKTMSTGSRWLVWATAITLLFFCGSGSRRSYYILPVVPFALMMTADWIVAKIPSWRIKLANITVIFFTLLNLIVFCLLIPLAYTGGGMPLFARQVRQQAITVRPWKDWNIVMLHAKAKTSFYLHSPNLVQFIRAKGKTKNHPTYQTLITSFPMLANTRPAPDQILILREKYLPKLPKTILQRYNAIHVTRTLGERILHQHDTTDPVALIPKQKTQQNLPSRGMHAHQHDTTGSVALIPQQKAQIKSSKT